MWTQEPAAIGSGYMLIQGLNKAQRCLSLHPVYLEKAKATAFIPRLFSSWHLKSPHKAHSTSNFSPCLEHIRNSPVCIDYWYFFLIFVRVGNKCISDCVFKQQTDSIYMFIYIQSRDEKCDLKKPLETHSTAAYQRRQHKSFEQSGKQWLVERAGMCSVGPSYRKKPVWL